MSCSVNIVLLCSNAIVREGLSRILTDRDFNMVYSCRSANDLVGLIDAEADGPAQLILIDNGTEECDSEAVTALRSRYPRSHLVILSDRFELQVMLQAFRLGVRAYIVKEISCDRLVGTLRLVAMGERVLPPQLADELQSRPALASAPEIEKSAESVALSEREREVLRWLIMGCPNKIISRNMEISEATVKVHVKAVLRKLSVKNRTQAAIWAANHGMRGRCYDVDQPPLAAVPHAARLPDIAVNGQFAHA